MLYSRKVAYSNIWRFDLRMPTQPAVPLTRGTSLLQVPRVSPDGQIVASQGTRTEQPHREVSGQRWRTHPNHFRHDRRPVSQAVGNLRSCRVALPNIESGQVMLMVSGRLKCTDAVTANPTTIAWLPDGRLAWQTVDGANYRIRDLTTGTKSC